MELDALDFKLNDFIFEIGGTYPDDKYKGMEEQYLLILCDKFKDIYHEERKNNKRSVMKSLLPMLLQVMMLTDKDSVYHSKEDAK